MGKKKEPDEIEAMLRRLLQYTLEEIDNWYMQLLKTGKYKRTYYGDIYSVILKTLDEYTEKKRKKKVRFGAPMPDPKRYDDYDAYNLDKTEYLDEFFMYYEDYLFDGGKVGLPCTSLDKMQHSCIWELVDMVRPHVEGKTKYSRLIYRLKPEIVQLVTQRGKVNGTISSKKTDK